ncbi:DUF5694 domain-containing protein [Aurantiacibacter luteus]|uniref:TraB/GumN family protein n=1 Tax=Aurantiacibacter luteus TaxID=1581420 RepID=A0A0G9N0D9_9SPHN|nr:DUF5694 domain-containing protein [Aurantiacibacter luteus]KLE35008.1 hypothetical protein AAW00_00435 [Aurantiacibacter luteus]
MERTPRALLALAALALSNSPALAQDDRPGAATEYADAAARERGNLSQLAVLGTSHLSSLPDDFDTARFDALLDRLAAWAPDRIAIESIGGAECAYLRDYAFAYPDVAETYCLNPAPALAALGMTQPAAAEELEAMLAEAAADRPAAERRRLALLFLATGNPTSAAVQWLRLPPEERVAQGPLTADLAAYLDRRLTRQNEDNIIAAPLAARLGHERVWPVDEQRGVRWLTPIAEEDFGAEMMALWNNPATQERMGNLTGWDARVAAGEPVIDWYRYMNSPTEQRLAVQGDFAAAAGSTLPRGAGRQYFAYWEMRNMRMAANVREVLGDGYRVLAVVGASHKPYYERYLGMTSDVEIADLDAILAAEANGG